jgi:hypothetical protein
MKSLIFVRIVIKHSTPILREAEIEMYPSHKNIWTFHKIQTS